MDQPARAPAGPDLTPAVSPGGDTRPGSSPAFLAIPLAVVSALAVIYLVLAPLSADHAAQTFRTELFELAGPTVWNNYWFGGHYLPTYSLLAPAIGAWIGFRAMGVVAVIGTVLLFGIIARKQWGEAARYGVIWFAVAATISLFSGRITFALGVLIATAAVFAAQRGSRLVSLVLAGATGLASPVAALFLACLGFGHFLNCRLESRSDRRGLELAAVAFAVSLLVALLFPGGGDEPYVWSSFIPTIGLTLVATAFVPSGQRLIRTGLFVYAASVVATFVLATPMGGNVNRLGTLLLGPMLMIALVADGARPRGVRAALLAVLLVLIAVWQVQPVARDLSLVKGEESVQASFYRPLERALAPRLATDPARVEVIPIASHWESARAAPTFPLARGWERQTDRHLNRLFYEDGLTAAEYRRWLDHLAVGWIAMPETELDYAGQREAALVRGGLDYLREVPVEGNWRLFRVIDATPMVDRPARMTRLTTGGFAVAAPRAGTFRVRVRESPYFRVSGGRGCVEPGEDGWTQVTFPAAGELAVETRFNPTARFSGGGDCRS